MTLHQHNENPKGFVRAMRHVYNPIGFKKGYNFVLFFIFAGALFGFCLARISYLNITGYSSSSFRVGAAPGEWYWYSKHFYKVGISLHLCAIIPCNLLAVFQFVPAIRYKLLLFHRINGYIVVILLLIGNVGALMIARHAFGGSLETQLGVGVLAIATTCSAALAYINIKRLQIDQHRAWMLRCFFYAGSIITLRIILIISALIISSLGSYWTIWECQKISYATGQGVANTYPACKANPNGLAIVHADLTTAKNGAEAGAALDLSFGMALWLALAMHAFGIEAYLRLTPAETERLRQVSYERQLERGFSHPGSAGLTVDRLGDAEAWQPHSKAKEGFVDADDRGSK